MDNKKEIYLTKQTYLHHLASSSTDISTNITNISIPVPYQIINSWVVVQEQLNRS